MSVSRTLFLTQDHLLYRLKSMFHVKHDYMKSPVERWVDFETDKHFLRPVMFRVYGLEISQYIIELVLFLLINIT